MTGSEQFSLNSVDFKKIVKGAAIAFGSAVVMQTSLFLSTGVAFDAKIWLTSLLAVGINATWKYLTNTKQ